MQAVQAQHAMTGLAQPNVSARQELPRYKVEVGGQDGQKTCSWL